MSAAVRYLAAGMITLTHLVESVTPVSAQRLPETLALQIDEVFAEWNRPGSPGAALVVVKDGVVVYEKGYGYANLDYDIPITPQTRFDIASVSKHFTAFAIALLADRRMLSLDDDIRKHLPELPDFGHTITIRHLVHHTSGVRDWVELLSMSGFRFDDVIALTDVMTFVQHQRDLNFDPGAEQLYSNTGYNLLAEIVARAGKRPFAQFMEEEIFRPLGMNDTHILMDHQRVMRNRATSYAPNEDIGELERLHARRPAADGTWRIWVDNTSAPGSSSVVTTVADMSRWLRNWGTGQIGGDGVLRQMMQRGMLNDGTQIRYAFGLNVGDFRGVPSISHGGGWRGFRTHFVRFPDQQLAIVVLGNSTSFNAGGAASRVAEVLLRDAVQLAPVAASGQGGRPSPQAAVPLPAQKLTEYHGVYWSDALGTHYTVGIRDATLVVTHRKMDDLVLTSVGGDRFVAPGVRGQLTFDFIRTDGRVVGYDLRGARFRGVRFDRQAP